MVDSLSLLRERIATKYFWKPSKVLIMIFLVSHIVKKKRKKSKTVRCETSYKTGIDIFSSNAPPPPPKPKRLFRERIIVWIIGTSTNTKYAIYLTRENKMLRMFAEIGYGYNCI